MRSWLGLNPSDPIAPLISSGQPEQYTAIAERCTFVRPPGRPRDLAAQLGERAPIEHYDVPTWMR
jgi:hypothetical protein